MSNEVVVVHLITPKALANLSPVVGAKRQPWGNKPIKQKTQKGFAARRTLFRVTNSFRFVVPGVVAALQPPG